MKSYNFTFHFKNGPITVTAWSYEDAEARAKAEAKKRGWNDKIIDGTDEKPNSADLIAINNCIMHIIEMEDVDTLDEQLDCIEALKKLRNKLKDKESAK